MLRAFDPLRSSSLPPRIGPLVLSGALALAAGCGGALVHRTPHEIYADSLAEAGLATTALGRAWLEAGQDALISPASVELPHRETVYFDPAAPSASSFRFDLERGRLLVARADAEPALGRAFLDLVELDPQDATSFDSVASAAETPVIEHEVEDDAGFVLRLQPELLRGGRVTLTIEARPTLVFPVAGRSGRDVGSLFGDPRDGGRRSHQGIDIMAPRGTLAVAAADARVASVSTNALGGKVVWLNDSSRSLSYYYAHLDEQLVKPGQSLHAGEPVGKVGNTGNARTTPSHLHFSVHGRRAARNPLPYITPSAAPGDVRAPTSGLGAWARVASRRARLRSAPTTEAPVLAELEPATALRLAGATGDWYRVALPDGRAGYIAARLTELADRPVARVAVTEAVVLRSQPLSGAATIASVSNVKLPVLARFERHALVQAPDERLAWLEERTD